MTYVVDKRKKGQRQILYKTGGVDISDKHSAIMEGSFDYIAPCPMCEKRVFDVSDPPDRPTIIRFKCPHCKRIVSIPIYELTSHIR